MAVIILLMKYSIVCQLVDLDLVPDLTFVGVAILGPLEFDLFVVGEFLDNLEVLDKVTVGVANYLRVAN